jgi:hypothetical protein
VEHEADAGEEVRVGVFLGAVRGHGEGPGRSGDWGLGFVWVGPVIDLKMEVGMGISDTLLLGFGFRGARYDLYLSKLEFKLCGPRHWVKLGRWIPMMPPSSRRSGLWR